MPALNFLGRYTRTPALNRFLCVWIHCEIFGLLAHKKSGNILYYKNGLDLNLNTKRIGSFIGIWTWDSKIAKWKWQDSNPCKKVAFWYFSHVNDSVTFVTNKYERTQKKIHSQCDSWHWTPIYYVASLFKREKNWSTLVSPKLVFWKV